MPYVLSPGRRIRRSLLVLALASAAPAAAQYATGAIVQPLAGADDPAEKLAAALRMLAVSPRDLGALIEAGRDALTLGDPNAAVGFFGRASEVSPRDGRVKAGLGAALVQLEKPRDALRYFQEASALGVPDADLAEDRGLAYDLVGDPAHAQADYRIVLAAHPDDDAARRRLALSQGISGDRAGAIATLDPLIRKRDIAAWRAQTFVLAMTGDAKAANDITRVMLPQQQAMLQPFLERLATLSPGDKARAVHFGEMPAAGRSYSDTQLASIGTPPTYAPAPVATRTPLPVRTPPAVAPVHVAATPPATHVAPPSPAPLAALTAHPRPVIGHERFVSATGVPMRRIEHSAQEMMAFGMPRYEYVPITHDAPSHARSAPPTVAPAPATTSVAAATPVAAAPRMLSQSPSTASTPEKVASIGPAPMPVPVATMNPLPELPSPVVSIPVGAPVPVGLAPAASAPLPANVAVAMPLGASGAAGHFDVPHEIADRRPIPRTVQATARPPAVAVAMAPLAPAEPVPASEPGSANPTVATARRALESGTALASTARPARSGRAHSATEQAGDAAVAPIAEAASPRPHGSEKARRGTDKSTDKDEKTSGVSTDRKEAHRDRSHDRTSRDMDEKAASDAAGARSADRLSKHGDHAHRAGRDADDGSGSSRRDAGQDRTAAGGDDSDKSSRERSARAKAGKEKPGKDETEKASAAPRVYVQVAGGADKADLDKAWAGVKAKAPDLMKGRKPATTPLHATNRLLVGPFKDEDEAQAFVNKMAGKGLTGFTFKSSKGQKVEKVDSGK